MQIETRRLLLRDFTHQDVQAVHAFDSDPELRRYRGGGRDSEQDTHAFIERTLQWQSEEPRPTFAFAVVLKPQAEIIGVVCLSITTGECNQGELWYRLSRNHWSQGYMTEAASAMLSFGFTALHLHRIWARCHPDNIGSWRVMEKLGMDYEGHMPDNAPKDDGTWHETVLYAILDHQWRASLGLT